MMDDKRRLLAALVLGLLLWTIGNTQSASAQSTLTNGSFDNPYSNGVASGWAPWHEERNGEGDCSSETILHRPSWEPEEVGGKDGQLWFDGTRSQHIGNSFATWHAGVFQNIDVSPGTYSFSTRAWGRASQDQYPASSDGTVPFTVRVGIDPTGGGLWTSSNIIWGPSISPHDSWQQVSVDATTSGNTISVFIAANFGGAGHCRKHLDIWLDAASLQSQTPPTSVAPTSPPATATTKWVPTATPNWNATLTTVANQATPTSPPTTDAPPTAIPTNTPLPPSATPNWNATSTVRARQSTPTPNWNATLTAQAEPAQQVSTLVPITVFQPTSVPVVAATDEPDPTEAAADSGEAAVVEEPTAIPVPTNTPAPQGGTICVNTFADANANGLRDSLEGYMANVPLIIGRNGTIINQGTSSGTDAPICFEGLEPGEYEVAQKLPGSLEMTTAGNLSIDVAAGQVIGLEFGSRVRQAQPEIEVDEVAEVVVTSSETGDTITSGTNGEGALSTSGSGNTLTVVGIALAGVAVLLLAGVLIALLRK